MLDLFPPFPLQQITQQFTTFFTRVGSFITALLFETIAYLKNHLGRHDDTMFPL